MHIGTLDLTEKWRALVEQDKFTRRHRDESLDIQYGVQRKPDGRYRFFVSGKEAGRDVTEEGFLDETSEGIFQKRFNRLRKLRPGGQDRKPGRQDDLPAGAERCGFYCQDPTNPLSLLVRPMLGTVSPKEVPGLHFSWNVYPNLAPFEPGGHFLLLPSGNFPELPHFPQLFTPLLLQDSFNLCQQSKELMVFFNSRHAGATQDHFHLQALFRESPFPIEAATRNRFGNRLGEYIGVDYPLNALVYTVSDSEAWCRYILKLQTKGIPLNLVFLNDRFFVVPRDVNNEIVAEFPNVLASMEISGKFIIPDREAFARATEERIRVALRRITLALGDIA